ncbi:MAG TPA: cyanophycinase [Puia sp.]
MDTSQECPTPNGILVIIGGKEDKGGGAAPGREKPDGLVGDQILKEFVRLISKDHAVIEVVTSGSDEGPATFAEYRKVFQDLGQQHIGHIHHNSRDEILKDNSILERIEKLDALFIAGGDQLELTAMYGGTQFLTRLKQRYIREHIIIAGTSAGAMALSTPMIYAGNEEVQQVSGEIKVTTGFEFLKDVCVDTHFVHRSRFVRLAQVIATNPGCIGLGIEEDTAVVIRNGVEAAIVGSGTIFRIEGFNIGQANMQNFMDKKPFSVRNLSVDILASGDKFTIPQKNPAHK